MAGFYAVAYFLISLFCSLGLFALWSRLILRVLKVSSLHPAGELIYRCTDPLVKPLAELLKQPALAKNFELSSFILIVLIDFFKFLLLGLLQFGNFLPLQYLLLFVLCDLIAIPANLLFYLILIRVLMSYIKPQWSGPFAELIQIITNPLLAFGRRIVPDISGFDFSPFVMLILLKIINLFMTASIPLH